MRKPRSSSARSPRGTEGRSASPRVWLGGRFSLRAYVHEGEPYRPEVVLWLEQESGVVRAVHLTRPPLDRAAIATSLEQAIVAPLAGAPGEPRLVRVGDAEIADVARSVLSPGITVEVGRVDELDAVAEQLDGAIAAGPPPETTPRARPARGRRKRDEARDDSEGYLCGGRVRPQVVASLFAASARLADVAPWEQMSDSAVLGVDVPSLGITGACLSVIGALDQNVGYVLFDSAGSYEAFLALAERIGVEDGPPPRIRGYLQSLNLVRWQELSATMRREARAHGWTVSSPRGYPELICLDPDGVPRPHAERDYVLAAACAAALADFCADHEGDLDPPPWPPVTRQCSIEVAGTGVEVSLTLPHPGAAEFADLHAPVPPPVASAPAALPRVGRNEHCPCGSGRKFKRCHGGAPAPEPTAEARADERAERAKLWHERDGRLIGEMFEVAKLRFPVEWTAVGEAADRLVEDRMGPQILTPWMAYHARLRDRPLVDWFLQMRGGYLVRADRAWLEAGRKAWMSVWEVIGVEPGRTIELRDVLTGEERVVVESSASRGIARFEAMLARVVSIDDLSLLCGAHPRILKPRPADGVAQAVRKRLRLRSKAVAIERMRAEQATLALIRTWERAVAAEDARAAAREVCNTDGHRLLLTTDRYRFAPARRTEIVERLATIGEREADEDPVADGAHATVRLSITRAADLRKTGLDSVVVCHLAVQRDVLLVETNSRERAEEMRALVERTCEGLVEHAGRSHADPTSSARRRDDADPGVDEAPPVEAVEQLLSLKRRHYEAWLDMPIPSLDGHTPREASRMAGGHRQLAVLLREIENIEARSPEGQRLDVSGLWRDLGLERPC